MSAKSAILIDFDNIFSGLWELDRDTARLFANDPGFWMAVLREEHLVAGTRRWLVARAYLNPAGYVMDGSDRLYLSRFRPALVRAGFDVIDCPAMTRSGKNAADIRIVIDALDLLASNTRYDEFVIASGDSDFAPLLQRLRANDRRITVMSPGFASSAYTSLADKLLDFVAIRDLVHPKSDDETDVPALGNMAATSPDGGAAGDAERQAFIRFVSSRYEEATAPLNLASLSQEAGRMIPNARESGWFGAGSFKAAILGLNLPNAELSQHYLWDEERHAPPAGATGDGEVDLPAPVQLLAQALELPRLRKEAWPRVFDVLARYAAEHDFNLTESSRWARDELAALGEPVSRGALNHVIRGTQMGGVPLNRAVPPTAEEIAEAYYNNLGDRAGYFGLNLSADDEDVVADWLGLPPVDDD